MDDQTLTSIMEIADRSIYADAARRELSGGAHIDEERKQELLRYLIRSLSEGMGVHGSAKGSPTEMWDAFRALVNTREPRLASEDFYTAQDELLQGMIAEKGISTCDDAFRSHRNSALRLWRGDITTLAVDAIVNAANSQMLGCWVPGHFCIDNAIHTFAGIQLRRECFELMEIQGHDEPTGQAKLTHAWNLPANRIIHTVGPIAMGSTSDLLRSQLASCYRSCLDMAAEARLSSIAFCSISTGVFGFPANEAAKIATSTVQQWLADHSDYPITVVFNVFSESDEAIYRATELFRETES